MRRLPRTIDKPMEIMGFRFEELGAFAGAVALGIFVDYFFSGLIFAAALALFLRAARRGRPDGYVIHLVAYRALGIDFRGKLLPKDLRRMSG